MYCWFILAYKVRSNVCIFRVSGLNRRAPSEVVLHVVCAQLQPPSVFILFIDVQEGLR